MATQAARLYHQGLFPVLVLTGANSPTTIARFPRGEASHYREHILDLGVPSRPSWSSRPRQHRAEHRRSRAVLRGSSGGSALLISKPYMQRRALPPADRLAGCAYLRRRMVDMTDYVHRRGHRLVIEHLVGDLQRIADYPARGFAIAQPIPDRVMAAYQRLVQAGFTSRLLPG